MYQSCWYKCAICELYTTLYIERIVSIGEKLGYTSPHLQDFVQKQIELEENKITDELGREERATAKEQRKI